jgi:hypothetical protein
MESREICLVQTTLALPYSNNSSWLLVLSCVYTTYNMYFILHNIHIYSRLYHTDTYAAAVDTRYRHMVVKNTITHILAPHRRSARNLVIKSAATIWDNDKCRQVFITRPALELLL